MDALVVAEASPHREDEPAVPDENGSDESPDAENKFQKAISAWRGMSNPERPAGNRD